MSLVAGASQHAPGGTADISQVLLLIRERGLGPGGELDELLRRRELEPFAALDAARLARHSRQEDGDSRAAKRLQVLGHAARADPLSRVSGLRADELNGVTGEETCTSCSSSEAVRAMRRPSAARLGFSGPVAMCTRIVAMLLRRRAAT
jgi:hypothetical protein